MLQGRDVWLKGCPSGYTQHLANIEDNCEIHYCVRAKSLIGKYESPVLQRPPYGLTAPKPSIFAEVNNEIVSPNGEVWLRSSPNEKWQHQRMDMSSVVDDSVFTIAPLRHEEDDERTAKVVGIIVGTLCGAVALLASLTLLERYSRKRARARRAANREEHRDESLAGSVNDLQTEDSS